jgi:hypothetical protein
MQVCRLPRMCVSKTKTPNRLGWVFRWQGQEIQETVGSAWILVAQHLIVLFALDERGCIDEHGEDRSSIRMLVTRERLSEPCRV